ncbi:MAG TPA: tyrosine--tRNA ligase [Bacilli bacterium]|nr:tyrosine--tRNA ligase [Bacilli bacterium]
MTTNILHELEWRGLIHQTTDQEGLEKKLAEGPIALYCGFDPTADSLHIGNFVSILLLKRFQMAGHNPIALVGGATGLIGDPSGKANERTLNTTETVQQFSDKVRAQLSGLLDFESETNPAILVNNYDWTAPLDVISFLRDIGKSFGINYMLAKESVSARLEAGISFTEFSYMILQANDFLNLYRQHKCILQVGGSDQWGNITAGMELIRKQESGEAYGLTSPLVTKADGTKFGKTESGTIWLDPKKTTPYEFYQFWLNADDRDVVNYLKYFTFLTQEEIAKLEEEVKTNPGAREAQRTLAREVTIIVHGEAALAKAEKISQVLFSGQVNDLAGDEIEEAFKDVPSHTMESDEPVNIVPFLVTAGVCQSNRQAREDVTNGAISLNGEKVRDLEKTIEAGDRIEGKYIVVRRGKKKYFLVKFA